MATSNFGSMLARRNLVAGSGRKGVQRPKKASLSSTTKAPKPATVVKKGASGRGRGRPRKIVEPLPQNDDSEMASEQSNQDAGEQDDEDSNEEDVDNSECDQEMHQRGGATAHQMNHAYIGPQSCNAHSTGRS